VNQLSGLGATVAVHERQITQLISDVATNTNNIETSQSAIAGHTAHLKEIDTSIENLNELLEDTVKTEELLALGQTVATHTNQINELYNTTNNHENRLKNAEDKLSDQGQLLNTARADLDEQKDKVAMHRLQIQQLQTDYAALNLSPADVVNIKNSINEFEEDIDNIENLVTDMTSNIATNTNQISSLKTRIDDADGNISINRGIIDEHGQDILRQGMEIDELRKEIDSKQANLVPGTNIEIVYNEETKETIINSTAQVNNNWGGITGDITEQEDLIEILNTKVEVSDEEPTDVEFSYQNQIDDIRSQLLALQKQLNGLTFIPTTQGEYEDLGTYDENTVYIAKEN
jgi:chromosome segregation ATPase